MQQRRQRESRWGRESDVEKRAQPSYEVVDLDEGGDVHKRRALFYRMCSSFHSSKAALHDLGVKGALKTVRIGRKVGVTTEKTL